MDRIGVIVQARMSSKRLPGKVLLRVNEKPMLAYLIERLRHCNNIDEMIIATSDSRSDDSIAEFCSASAIACYRGSLNNVAARFLDTARHFGLDAFVRVSGDSPMLDQRIVDKAVLIFREDKWDFVTNKSNAQRRTFPKGQTVEVVRTGCFEKALPIMSLPEDFEHVTNIFYRTPKMFRIREFTCRRNIGHVQLSVDTAEDMDLFTRIVMTADRPLWEYTLEEILELRDALDTGRNNLK